MNALDTVNVVAGLLQFLVAGYALRLNRIFGPQRVGWSLFCAFSLLALLHLTQSAGASEVGTHSAMLIEVMYSLISLLLLVGMAHLETLFVERLRAEHESVRLRGELELEVKKKTIYLTRTIEALQVEIDERKRMEAELEAHIELLAATQRTPAVAAGNYQKYVST
jgi:hypothetical protein